MTFTNVEIDLDTLPRSADVEYHDLDPRYARVVLGVVLAFEAPVFAFAVILFVGAASRGGAAATAAGLLLAAVALILGFLAWFSYKSARVIRYALREHDVIVQSGVFWKKETVQPIRRIQHIEQHQGPIDKRFGLYELKLFSAGTAYLTFRIPGLDAETASRIRQFILKVQEDGWAAEEPPDADRVVVPNDEPADSAAAVDVARGDSNG